MSIKKSLFENVEVIRANLEGISRIPALSHRVPELEAKLAQAQAELDKAIEKNEQIELARLEREEIRANSVAFVLEIDEHNATISSKRVYSDDEVRLVIDSNLTTKDRKDILSLARELSMNYYSLIYFLRQKAFALGAKRWSNVQSRVAAMIAGNDPEFYADILERNAVCYKAWEEKSNKKTP